MTWVNETLPPRERARWLLITMRLSISSFAGTARTLVAVGISRLLSMLATTRADDPRSVVVATAPSPSAGAVFAGSGLVEAGVVAGFVVVPAAGAAVGGLAFASVGVAGPAFAGPGWRPHGPRPARPSGRHLRARLCPSVGSRVGSGLFRGRAHGCLPARLAGALVTVGLLLGRKPGEVLRPRPLDAGRVRAPAFVQLLHEPLVRPEARQRAGLRCHRSLRLLPARQSKLLVVQASRRFQPMYSPPVVDRARALLRAHLGRRTRRTHLGPRPMSRNSRCALFHPRRR